MVASGDHTYMVIGSGLIIVDYSTIIDPKAVGTLDISGANSIRLYGTTALIGLSDKGFALVDVSDVTNPIKIGSYNTSSTIKDMIIKSNTLYTVDGNYLRVFDISTPTSISAPANYALDGQEAYAVSTRLFSDGRPPSRLLQALL